MAAPESMRALYLTAGIRAPGAMATLDKLDRKFGATQASAARFQETLANINGLMGRGTAAGMGNVGRDFAGHITRARRELRAMNTDMERLVRTSHKLQLGGGQATGGGGGGGGAPLVIAGVGGGRAPGGRGVTGFLGRSLTRAFALTGVYAVGRQMGEQADIGYNISRAANIPQAMGQAPVSIAEQRRATQAVMRYTGLRAREASELGLSVAQIGIRDAGQRSALTAAAGAFAQVEPGFDAAEAAKMAYRLGRATNAAPGSESRILSAVLRAGDVSPAGAQDVADMLLSIQSALSIGRFETGEGIGLAAALASIDPYSREAARGSITRIFADPKVRALAGGLAAQQGVDINTATGGQTLMAIARQTRGMSEEGRMGVLSALTGFSNVRDRKFLVDLSNSLDEFVETSQVATEEMARNSEYLNQVIQQRRGTFRGAIDQAMAGLDILGMKLESTLGPLAGGVGVGIGAAAGGLANAPLAMAGLAAGGAFLASRRFGMVGRAGRWAFGTNQGSMLTGIAGGTARRGMQGPNAPSILTRLSTRGWGVGLAARATGGAARIALNPIGTAAGLLAKRAGTGLIGRGLGFLAGGPAGLAMGALAMFQPMAEGLGAMFRSIGQQGGAVGFLANTLSLLFNVVSAVGKGINMVIDGISTAIGWLFNNPLVKPIFDFIGGGIGAVSDWFGSFGGGGAGTSVTQNYSVSVVNPSQMQALVEKSGRLATRSLPSASYVGG